MKHSRNNFVEFRNPDLREEGRKALDRRKTRRKRIRNFSVITFICAVIVIVSVFLFPQQFSTFSLSSIFNNISALLPKNTSDTAVSKNIKLQSNNGKQSTPYPEYQFTEQQVENAKIAILNKQKNKGSTLTLPYIEKLLEKNREGEYRYEIELLTGRRLYGETAQLNNDIISFESRKGLTVALRVSEIKDIHLLRRTEKHKN